MELKNNHIMNNSFYKSFEVNLQTWELFDEYKLSLVMFDNKKIVNVNEKNQLFLTLYPLENKFVLNKIIGRDLELNMLIISSENEKDFFVYNNQDLKNILQVIKL